MSVLKILTATLSAHNITVEKVGDTNILDAERHMQELLRRSSEPWDLVMVWEEGMILCRRGVLNDTFETIAYSTPCCGKGMSHTFPMTVTASMLSLFSGNTMDYDWLLGLVRRYRMICLWRSNAGELHHREER